MSSSNCCLLTCIQVSQEVGQMVWYSHLFQNIPVYCDPHSHRHWQSQLSRNRCFSGTLLLFQWSSGCWQFNLWFLYLFCKTSLNFWKFTVHVLLKPGLENFEHYFTSVWDECNCVVIWAFFVMTFFGIGMKTDIFQSCGHCWSSQILGLWPARLLCLWNSPSNNTRQGCHALL